MATVAGLAILWSGESETNLAAGLAARTEESLAYEPDREPLDGLPVAELMVERAIQTSAAVTPVEGDAAAELAEHGGVAALLRY